ncbi:hypothetical protein AU252_14135 [Pseudarthrobacter sulfonivorans]|uniref:Bacterial Ig-like domain-containing protein n=1 Tax=Pseudarthrobacter sulfonivorans TaxID=121292 RepID=A0A0U3GSG2_9MICC|nr:hypothetical protein [Pseudarthrobacter sulfonivorans]ALV42150.1 hypothetical protein AU252_14135 [Pseudarthrobacter sulfonivorans]
MSRPIQTLPHVQPPRARRKARIASIMAAALVISWGAPAADAYWQTLSSNNGGAGADAIVAVAALTASASAGAASVSWAQSTTAAGRPVSGYTVARYSSETGGTKVAALGGCEGTVTALTCSEAALPAGTWYYTVTPVLAAWAGPESARSGGVAGTPLASPTIDPPSPVKIANADRAEVSGTAGAGWSVTVTATDAGGAFRVSQPVSATGSGQWTVSNFNLTGLADGTISYTAVATDAVGNVSAPGIAATTTKDTRAPSVAAVTLFNGSGNAKDGKVDVGDKVVIKFSEALDASSICSDWNNTNPVQSITGSGVVVAINSSNSLSVSATSGCPTLRFGSVALGASYYGSGNLQFGGSSLAWDQSTLQLTVTLGSVSSGNPGNATQQANIPRYTPQTGLTDIVGNPLPITQISGAPASRF